MRKVDWAYMAGFFDGEGCVTLSRKKPYGSNKNGSVYLDVSVSQSNEWIIQLFKMHFGGYVSRKTSPKGRRSHWIWQAKNKKGLAFLKVIYPYLRLKRAEAFLGIEFQENFSGCQGRVKTEGEVAILEAQRILMHNLKDKSNY